MNTKQLLLFLIAVQAFQSCSTNKFDTDWKDKFNDLDAWSAEIEKHDLDTFEVGAWLTNPPIKLKFTNEIDSVSLNPTFDFYPISLEKYLTQKLHYYLYYRSSLTSPLPNTYISDTYFVVGWNLTNLAGEMCRACEELETELISEFDLRRDKTPFKLNLTLSSKY